MKQRKFAKLLTLVLTLCLLAAALPLSASAADYSGSCGANLKWELSGDTLTISGEGAMNDYGNYSEQPWWRHHGDITKIVVQSGVTYIGSSAFACDDMVTEITLPDTLTGIGEYAFSATRKLQGITIPSGVTVIPDGCFTGAYNMTYASLPDTVTAIGDSAFFKCSKLTDVNIPSSVTSIGYQAFYSCGITSATISGKAVLGERAFNGSGLVSVKLSDGLKEIPAYAFYVNTALKEITIPGSVKAIQSHAFERCTSLADCTIEEGVQEIYSCAFEGCSALSEVTIPSTCTYIGVSAFHNVNAKTITVLNPDCSIYKSNWTLGVVGITTIRGYKGSTAEAYATEYGFSFEPLKGEEKPPVSFTDVKAGEYFYQPVLWAVEKGITSGTSATTFSPNQACTRAQAVTFLWNAAGQPNPASSRNPFTDVKPDAYYYKAVLWAVEKGITSGTSATTFSPNQVCARGQITTFLYKAAGSPSISGNNPFKDVQSGNYFYTPVLWAVKNGITSGTSATAFSPNQACTRGQIVTFLYKYCA